MVPLSVLCEERYGDAAAPAITFSSSIVTHATKDTGRRPSPSLTFEHGLVSVDIRRGEILLETTIVVSRSNKSASVSVGWLNHICYQYHVA